jgi:predicted transcriptional regulator
MVMAYRSRTEIVTQILEIANGGGSSYDNGGVSKTRIMHKANLNYSQLQTYLLILIEHDLLRYDGQTHSFKTTEKGFSFLSAYDQIDQLMKEQEI